MNVVAELENFFLPLLREAEQCFAAEYPAFKFQVWFSSTGGRTAYQGHDLGLECLFPDASTDEANCLVLTIGVMYLTSEPKLCDASVGWGTGDHPDTSINLIDNPLPFTREALLTVGARFPEIVAIFQEALEAWISRGTRV
jgi:hypothetical protein